MLHDTPAFSGVSTNDLAAAKTFYADTLGLFVDETPQGLMLVFTNGHSVFIYPKENHEPASFTVLNFPVKDIDAAMDALEAKGVSFEHYEGMHQDDRGIARGRAEHMGPDIAWFKDPAGNTLAILQD